MAKTGVHRKKRLIDGITLFLVFVLITGCTNQNTYQKSIYNDDAKIATQGDSYTFIERIGEAKDARLELQFKGFSGKQTIWTIQSDNPETLHIEVDTSLRSGNFKVVLLQADKSLGLVSEGIQSIEKAFQLQIGKSYLVIVGLSASGSVEIGLDCEGVCVITSAE